MSLDTSPLFVSVKDSPQGADVKEGMLAPLAATTTSKVERVVQWEPHENMVLLDGKKKLVDEMASGQLKKSVRTKAERWDYVANFCAEAGVFKTSAQCNYKWQRIWKPFKLIFDYERNIPSGFDSYWSTYPKKKVDPKLPKKWDKHLYEAMLRRFGGDRATKVDIQNNLLGHDKQEAFIQDCPQATDDLDEDDSMEIAPTKKRTNGIKRKGLSGLSNITKEFEKSTRQLLDFFGHMEEDRLRSQKDLIEILRMEIEENRRLQNERLQIERENNRVLLEVASAIKSLLQFLGNSQKD